MLLFVSVVSNFCAEDPAGKDISKVGGSAVGNGESFDVNEVPIMIT